MLAGKADNELSIKVVIETGPSWGLGQRYGKRNPLANDSPASRHRQEELSPEISSQMRRGGGV